MECNACGMELFKTIFNGNEVAKCDNCGSIYTNPDIISKTRPRKQVVENDVSERA